MANIMLENYSNDDNKIIGQAITISKKENPERQNNNHNQSYQSNYKSNKFKYEDRYRSNRRNVVPSIKFRATNL